MFEIYNPTPDVVQVDLNNKRAVFASGETKGMWDTGGYFTHDETVIITDQLKGWGRKGIVWKQDNEPRQDARQRGLELFVRHVYNTVRDWYGRNTELMSQRRPPLPLYMQKIDNERTLEDYVKMAEAVSESRGYNGFKLTMADVINRFNQIVGTSNINIVQGGDTAKTDANITELLAKFNMISERLELVESENDSLRAKINGGASREKSPAKAENPEPVKEA